MKRISRFVFLVAVLFSTSGMARATMVSWELQGHLTQVTGAPPDFLAGDPFRIRVNFDTSAALQATQPGTTGFRYSYDPSSLSFDLFIGTTCTISSPCHPAASNPGSTGFIFLRDGFSSPPGFPQPIDGYTFGILNSDGINFQIAMRGPILDLVNGPGLAASPDPRLASFGTPGFSSNFQVCGPVPSCSSVEIDGQIESVSRVPEPNVLGLLAAGMLGFAAVRRRERDSVRRNGKSSRAGALVR